MRPMSSTIKDTLPEVLLVSAATTFPPIFALMTPEVDSDLNMTPAFSVAVTSPDTVLRIVSPTTPMLSRKMVPETDLMFKPRVERFEILTGDEAVLMVMFFMSHEEGINTSRSFLKRRGSIHTPLEAKFTVSFPSSVVGDQYTYGDGSTKISLKTSSGKVHAFGA